MGNFDFESGKRYLEEGDAAEAIRCLLSSLAMDPSCVPAYVALMHSYELAWTESHDPDVLDQIRKVSLAGLKRNPDTDQRQVLTEGLDRADDRLLALAREDETARRRRLPLITDPADRLGREGGS